MLTLSFPKRQSIAFSNTIFRLYDQAKKTKEDEVVFDLSRSEFLTPFSTIMLTSTISECIDQGKKCKYVAPKKNSLRSFLKKIGFYGFFGINKSKSKTESITTDRVQLKRANGIDPQLIDQIIIVFDNSLNLSAGVKGSLRMSMQETMTNVIDHSNCNDYYVCAWTYPEKKKIRLCIADLGIGILASLKSSNNYRDLTDDYEAIALATEEGVSCRSERTGLGLNHIKKFIEVNKGQMCIISGKGKVFWKFDQRRRERQNQNMAIPFNGTIVKLVINIDKEGFYFLSSEKEYLI